MENKELETWLKETKAKNLTEIELEDYIDEFMPFSMYHKVRSELNVFQVKDVAKSLFNQWQKEKEFSPKRGDRILAWDNYDNKLVERTFLTEVKGSITPILVVHSEYEEEFLKNEPFKFTEYEHMKPLPTEQPKETIEEASEIYAEQNAKDPNISYHNLFSPLKYAFIEGARWQSEQPKEEIRICKYCGAKLDTNEKEEECYAKPKETDFKSQVIELLKVLIDESLEKLGAALNAKSYQDVLAWKISNQERGQLLEKIEQLN